MTAIGLPTGSSEDLLPDYLGHGFDRLADTELVARVAQAISVPRIAPADSFVLHAPLELIARAALLPWVRPAHREQARLRLVALADKFEAFGPPVSRPRALELDSIDDAAARLVAAVDRGELEDVDAAACWLGRTASPSELQRVLSDALLRRLGAAAHAPIFLYHLPRVSPRGEVTGELLRGLARELGRSGLRQLHWVDDRGDRPAATPMAMFHALAATPPGHHEGRTPFIDPLMSAVDSTAGGNGLAAQLLTDVTGGFDVRDRGRAVLRAAAWSMLLEPGDHAPYGWTHSLTMSQAVLGIAGATSDPGAALAVAATYVVGFRAALARNSLDSHFPAPGPRIAWREALSAPPAVAAAAVWHAPPESIPDLRIELATRASLHHDAHLVKYTLSCLDAAADDPSQGRLFLGAAASLVGWWAQVPDGYDPLAT